MNADDIFPIGSSWNTEDLSHLNVVGTVYTEEREGKKGGNLYSWWADESGALHCRQFLFEFLFLPWTCCSAEQCPTKKDEHNKRTNYYIFTKNYSSLTLVIMKSHTMWLPLTCCVRSHQCSKIILQSGLFMESASYVHHHSICRKIHF